MSSHFMPHRQKGMEADAVTCARIAVQSERFELGFQEVLCTLDACAYWMSISQLQSSCEAMGSDENYISKPTQASGFAECIYVCMYACMHVYVLYPFSALVCFMSLLCIRLF